MSISLFWAAPHMVEPSAKKAIAVRSIGFRPKMDAKPPHIGRTAVEDNAYALPAHMKSVPWRCPTIVGSAVEIAVCDQSRLCYKNLQRAAYEIYSG